MPCTARSAIWHACIDAIVLVRPAVAAKCAADFGASALDQFAADLGVSAGKVLTKDLIKKFLSKGTLKQFKKIMLKYFGIKVTQKGIITKSLPIVGGLIGAGWNAIEVSIMKQRVIDYFREEAILTEVIIVDELGKT